MPSVSASTVRVARHLILSRCTCICRPCTSRRSEDFPPQRRQDCADVETATSCDRYARHAGYRDELAATTRNRYDIAYATIRRSVVMTGAAPIDRSAPPTGTGCVECSASGGWWLHLRRCAACGHIGCCDSSPSQHASKHAGLSAHPVAQSYEPDEDWFWDYVNGRYVTGSPLQPPTSHPRSQPVPGPAGAVPPDWQTHLH
jgi:hypothetical protein